MGMKHDKPKINLKSHDSFKLSQVDLFLSWLVSTSLVHLKNILGL
jgi:hypothetical protein